MTYFFPGMLGCSAGQFYYNLAQIESFGKRESQLRKCSHKTVLSSIFLIDDWCGRALLSVGNAISGAGHPGWLLRKQAELVLFCFY